MSLLKKHAAFDTETKTQTAFEWCRRFDRVLDREKKKHLNRPDGDARAIVSFSYQDGKQIKIACTRIQAPDVITGKSENGVVFFFQHLAPTGTAAASSALTRRRGNERRREKNPNKSIVNQRTVET